MPHHCSRVFNANMSKNLDDTALIPIINGVVSPIHMHWCRNTRPRIPTSGQQKKAKLYNNWNIFNGQVSVFMSYDICYQLHNSLVRNAAWFITIRGVLAQSKLLHTIGRPTYITLMHDGLLALKLKGFDNFWVLIKINFENFHFNIWV